MQTQRRASERDPSPAFPSAPAAPAAEIFRLKKLYELSMTLSGDPVDIFNYVAKMIGELFDLKVVCLSEIRGNELFFLSVYVQGTIYSNAGTCPLSITPCATVEESKDIRIYDKVIERFPEASFLRDHDAYSYCGFPTLSNEGKVVAVTCMLDDRPREFSEEDQEILRIFGQRIGMEIERQHHIVEREKVEEELRRHRDHLEALVESRTAQLKAAQDELIRKERLATLGQLNATVSHELRNPLAAIRNSLYPIAEKARDKGLGIESAIDRIERNVTRCDNIITELLDFTRIQKLEYKNVNIDDWLATDVIRELQITDGVQLRERLESHVDADIDPALLRRAILNVIENARQAMQTSERGASKPPVLTIASTTTDSSFNVIIGDTGPGIDPEIREHLFEPLYSTKGFGVGLGLPLVKQVVEQHGGKVAITTEVGQGTEVTLTLPLRRIH